MNVLQVVLPIFLIIALGYLIGKYKKYNVRVLRNLLVLSPEDGSPKLVKGAKLLLKVLKYSLWSKLGFPVNRTEIVGIGIKELRHFLFCHHVSSLRFSLSAMNFSKVVVSKSSSILLIFRAVVPRLTYDLNLLLMLIASRGWFGSMSLGWT